MLDAIASGAWVAIDGRTMRWDGPVKVAQGQGYVGIPDGSTYKPMVFLSTNRILGVGSAPWMGRRDSKITYKRAMEIIANPEAALEPHQR